MRYSSSLLQQAATTVMSSSALSNVKKTLTAPFVGAFQVMIEWRVWWPFLIESKHFTYIEYTRNQIKNIADACRPAPDRALRQGRIESCAYWPAAWFVFEFFTYAALYIPMARSLGRANCVWVRPAPWEVPHLLSYCQGCWQHPSTHQVWSFVV